VGTQLDLIHTASPSDVIRCKDGLHLKDEIGAGRYIECSAFTKEAYNVRTGRERELIYKNLKSLNKSISEILLLIIPQVLLDIIFAYYYQPENQLDVISSELILYCKECWEIHRKNHRSQVCALQ